MTARTTLAVITVSLVSLTSCATTIIDTAPTTTAVAPTTTIPSGTPDELFAQMQQTIALLSKALSESNKGVARLRLAEIESIWSTLKPQVAERGDQFVQDMQRIVDLAISSIERNRPADADKSLRFLTLVIETL
ncbi:MAG: hypothetical protein O3A24_00955 [Actinobacteria bacterium]|jgi:hypothetical protein|nr:MAG: hypothetical protein ABR67_00020 [Acidimicrobium sp. BACL17 MAG-120823-bin42]MDA0191971.1 hypothetical protein [Actinomycetota bacterium]MDA2951611.1 hypothetical protein [Actinomycetota bacterium]MDA2998884.1 hypothetical protein [Actinomycetota bacterium]